MSGPGNPITLEVNPPRLTGDMKTSQLPHSAKADDGYQEGQQCFTLLEMEELGGQMYVSMLSFRLGCFRLTDLQEIKGRV